MARHQLCQPCRAMMSFAKLCRLLTQLFSHALHKRFAIINGRWHSPPPGWKPPRLPCPQGAIYFKEDVLRVSRSRSKTVILSESEESLPGERFFALAQNDKAKA